MCVYVYQRFKRSGAYFCSPLLPSFAICINGVHFFGCIGTPGLWSGHCTQSKLGCPTESLHGNRELRSSTATAGEVSPPPGRGFGLKIWRRLGRYHLRTKVAEVKVMSIKNQTFSTHIVVAFKKERVGVMWILTTKTLSLKTHPLRQK